MKRLKNALSNMFSLLVPKKDSEVYSWGEIIIGLMMVALLAFAVSFLPK